MLTEKKVEKFTDDVDVLFTRLRGKEKGSIMLVAFQDSPEGPVHTRLSLGGETVSASKYQSK